ncbi:hypothetical protein CR513_35906, partial [Mucuna pruriens]
MWRIAVNEMAYSFCTASDLLGFITVTHDPPDSLLYAISCQQLFSLEVCSEGPLLCTQFHPNPSHLKLIAMHRPCNHGNPSTYGLHRGVPPTMRHERTNSGPFLLLFLALMLLPFLLRNNPYELVTRCFYRACDLVKLLIMEIANAPEAYIQNRVNSLRVEPTQALVHAHHALLPPLCFLLSGSANENRRADVPGFVARGFLVVAEVLFSVKLGEVVDDETVAFERQREQGFHEFTRGLGWG